MQQDLEVYLESYNRKPPHRGRGMEGRVPYVMFKGGLKKAKKAAESTPKADEKKATVGPTAESSGTPGKTQSTEGFEAPL